MHSTTLHSDDISLLSFKGELSNYSRELFKKDALAALSVSLLTIPQAMAYALLAGLPLSAGLFASIYSAMIAAIFGCSRHLITGPSNAIAILVQAATAEILFTYYRDLTGSAREMAALQILTQLALVVGIVQVLAASFKLGRLTQFVSHAVIIGYISGTALAVSVSQLFTFLGIENSSRGLSIYEQGVYLVTHVKQTHMPTAIVGGASLLFLLVLKRIDKRIPAALITLVLSAFLVHLLQHYSFDNVVLEAAAEKHWQQVSTVGDTGHLQDLLPSFSLPYFDMGLLNYLLPMAFAIALMSVMETTSVAKTIAANSGQRLSINQEIFGLGLGNLLSALMGVMPISGSASRSCLNYSSGAKTRLAAVFNPIWVAVLIYSFSFLILHVPLASLSALLLVTAMHIVQPRQFFLCIKATNSDAFVLWMTLLSCIFLSLDVAFYIGVIVSITLYLKKAAIPQLVEYDVDESGGLHHLDLVKLHEHKTIRLIKVKGELFFGAADLFQTTLKTIAEDDNATRVIILQLKSARDIDATVCLALQHLHDYLKSSGRFLIVCGMTQETWDVLSDSGIVEQIGKDNLFVFDERHPQSHHIKALHRARELAAQIVEEAIPQQAPAVSEAEIPGIKPLID